MLEIVFTSFEIKKENILKMYTLHVNKQWYKISREYIKSCDIGKALT